MAMQKVEWRNTHHPRYEVSSMGDVRNKETGRVLKPMITGSRRSGARRAKVRFSTTPRQDFDVAHLVLVAFVGPRPKGAVALHANDDSLDNRADNLRWGTHSNNALQCAMHTRGGGQKLNPQQVLEIARRRVGGERGATLAAEFGVSQQRVCDIHKRRSAILKELACDDAK